MSTRGSKRRSPARYQRAEPVVAYWHGGHFVVENFLERTRAVLPAAAARVLALCARPRTVHFLLRQLPEYRYEDAQQLIRELLLLKFLRPPGPAAALKKLAGQWKSWNPAAGFFHFSTKDVIYPKSPAEAAEFWRDLGPKTPMPRPTKRYPRLPTLRLPVSNSNGSELARVLIARRTWREFADSTVDLERLATVLNLTWGVQKWGHVPGEGDIPLKTSPSGGARHPGEVYVYVRRARGLEEGLYHYDSARHALARLPTKSLPRGITTFLPGQPWYRKAAVLLIMTAVFKRSQWRYNFPRAYRAVLIEAGHLCQTFCLVATSLGLAPFCSMAFPDSEVERFLGIDGVSESALYIAGLGIPPRHGWRPWKPNDLGRTSKAL